MVLSRAGSVWRRLVLWGLVGAVALALSGCSLEQFRTSDTDVSRLVFAGLSDPKTFNPVLNQEYPNIFLYTYRGLTQVDGNTGDVVPALAESWDVSEDGRTVVFTLRPDLRWSDGEPLTAADVDFTFNEVVFNEDIPTSSRDVMRVGEAGLLPTVELLDERRVEFNLPEPFAPFLRNMTIEILPAHALRESVQNRDGGGNLLFLSTWGTDTDPGALVSNGPYRLSRYVPSERLIYERNPYYWEQDELGTSLPYIEQLVTPIVESSDTAYLQFRSGGLDLIGVSPEFFSLLKSETERGDFTIYNAGPALGTSFLCFNLNKASRNGVPLVDPIKSRWFNTLEFRQAVSYAIDRQTMINSIFQGIGEPQTSPISVQSPYYAPPEAGVPTYDYDPERARELLLSAGFQYDASNQLLDADGNRVRFTVITSSGSSTSENIGSQIKRDLEVIGIQVDFQPIAFNLLVDKLTDSLDWEAHILGFTGGIEPNGGANVWLLDGSLHSFNQNATAGQEPLEGWEAADWEAEIARLYIQGAKEIDEEQRQAIYLQTQILTQTHLPFIYLVNPLNMGAVRNRVQNMQYSGVTLPSALWNVQELQLLQE